MLSTYKLISFFKLGFLSCLSTCPPLEENSFRLNLNDSGFIYVVVIEETQPNKSCRLTDGFQRLTANHNGVWSRGWML